MRLFTRPAPRCDELGFGLVTRLGRLQPPARVLAVRWLWLTDWLVGRKRRRGVRVS